MPAPAVYSLRNWQVGKEAAAGTAVAAAWRMVGDIIATPTIPRYFSDYPRGVMVPVTGGGTPLSQGTTFVQTSEVTYEEILYPLMTSMATGTVAGGAADKTWTFAPVITGDPGIQTFTSEWVLADGSATAFPFPGATGFPITLQTPYCFCTGFDVEWAFGAITKLTARYSGRASTFAAASVPTAGLTAMTGRERIPGSLVKTYLDTTFAGVGGTQLVGTVRSGKYSFNSGIEPDFTCDGRPAMDFTQLRWGMDRFATLQLVMEVNATSALEVRNWVAQNAGGSGLSPNTAGAGAVTPRFIRIEATSPNTLGISARRLRLDGCYIYTKEPAFQQQNRAELMTLDLKTEYDPTSAKSFQASVVNSLATFT